MVSPQVRSRLDLDLNTAEVVGRRVLLVAEQGIGDQVMFASIIADLKAIAPDITCVCDSRLIRLFSASFDDVKFLEPGAAHLVFSDFDKVIAMGSLGRLLRPRVESFPGTAFLRASAEVRERWAARLGPRTKRLRVGLSWRGGVPATGMAQRSLDLRQLTPLLSRPDCEFVSLQYGEPRAEVEAVSAELGVKIGLFPKAEIDDFEDLAGVIEALDVVVSVQNSVVHLAGALGKDCLTLVPCNPEWRYGARAPTMPWYRSVRIFRQVEFGAWSPVIRAVTRALDGQTGLSGAA
jgi:ADP-heptose:LPS heptosyltransferase